MDQRSTGERRSRREARDVVIGMVWGLEADTSRFVRSWLWHAPDVRIILLVPPGYDFARKAYLQEWGLSCESGHKTTRRNTGR